MLANRLLHSTDNSSEHSEILSTLNRLQKIDGQRHLHRRLEFEELRRGVQDIAKKIEDVNRLRNGPTKPNRFEVWEQQDLAIIESLKNLSTNFDGLVTLGRKVSTELSEVSERLILQSLCYKSMAIRHDKIVDAHAKTFEWIYHEYHLSEGSQHGTGFVEWLAHSTGIFWITGKAGSRKSTLLKYLSDLKKTRMLLESWSGQQELMVASFYFWYAGTEFQKSQEGLLKSLLYEILRQCPKFNSSSSTPALGTLLSKPLTI